MLLKMNITVYLGASSGNDDKFQIAIRELGNWIGENGHTLVYGGSKAGLMGDLAESVLLSGGKVIGVEPQFFIDAGFEYNDITELIVTHDMSEPVMIYNLDGYYNDLKNLFMHMIEKGLCDKKIFEKIRFVENLEEIKKLLNA